MRKLLLFVAMFTSLLVLLGNEESRRFRAEESQDVLKSLRSEHPRLIVTRDQDARLKELIAKDRAVANLFAAVRRDADAILSQPPIQHRLIGPRLLDQSRRCLSRVYTLTTVYRLTDERKYADRAIQEMLTAAAFPDWNPSHFLDTAEMTHALAIGYDWLFDVLTEEQRATIRRAIVERGLREGEKIYRRGGWWVKSSWNWNQVCNGGMTLGALAVAESEPDLAEFIITRAVKSLPIAMANYAPDGAWAEGPGYWSYATHYTVYMLAGLQTALGTDFGLSALPGFERAGDFRIHVLGPTGLAFNFADGSARFGAASPMLWLAKRFEKPLYGWHEQTIIRGQTPLHLWWYDRFDADLSQEPLGKWFRHADVVTMRSGWDRDALFVGFKGGDNAVNHSHLELGSFVLDALGVRWVLDLGPDDYNLPEYFGRLRWTYYRLGTQGQNTLLLDGQNQNPRAVAPVVAFMTSSERSHAVIDLSAAYPPGEKNPAQVQGTSPSILRGIALLGNSAVLVQDEITGHVGRDLQWQIHTEAKVTVQGAIAQLQEKDRRIELRILQPADLKFEIQSADPPPPQRQNTGVTKLAIRTKLTEQPLTLAVLFICRPEVGDSVPALRPLKDWEGAVKTAQ